MAKVKSLFHVSGKVGDVQFYTSDGEFQMRRDGSISKDRIQSEKAFKRTRENMSEFAGAAVAGASLRTGLSSVIASFKDRRTSSRLTAVFRRIIASDTGERGRRPVGLGAWKHLLKGFNFHRTDVLRGVFPGIYDVAVGSFRDTATLTVPDFNPDAVLNYPAGTTHFQFVFAIAALSDFTFDPTTGKYVPLVSDTEKQSEVVRSAYYSVLFPVGLDIVLNASLPPAFIMPSDASLVVCLGIEFYQQIGSVQYLLAQGNAMQIVEVA